MLNNPQLIQQLPQHKPLLQIVQQLQLNLVPPKTILEPQQITQSFKHSGLFLENRLAQPKTDPQILQNDIKANLNRLAVAIVKSAAQQAASNNPVVARAIVRMGDQEIASLIQTQWRIPHQEPKQQLHQLIQQTVDRSILEFSVKPRLSFSSVLGSLSATANNAAQPDEPPLMQLWRATIQALNKIQFQQLQTLAQQLSAQPDQATPLQTEIPIAHANGVDMVPIRIEKETGNAEDNPNDMEREWRVMLSFEFDTIGQLYIQLVTKGEQASATIWAEEEQSYQKAQLEIDKLSAGLTRAGFDVTEILCRHGTPEQPAFKFEQRLIDIHT